MKKLFFLVIPFLLSLFSFTHPAIGADEVSAPSATSTAPSIASASTSSSSTPSLSAASSAPNAANTTETEESDASLPEDILTADCLAFYQAKDIINLQEEPLYQKQTTLLKNLNFASRSRLRLSPQDTSLEALNRSFIEINFTGTRLLALDKLKTEYTTAVAQCLRTQAEEINKKTLADLESKKTAGLKKIETRNKKASQKIAKRVAKRVAKIERKAEKRLKRVDSEALVTEKNFKRQIKQASMSVATGKTASIYNKTLVSFEYKLEQLPLFVEKRKDEILAIKEQALEKTKEKESALKEKLEVESLKKTEELEQEIDKASKASEDLLKTTLAAAEKKASEQADTVYQARRDAVSKEGALVLARYNQGNALIVNLKKLWTTDKQKKLKELDLSALNLEEARVTVRGVSVSSNKKGGSKAASRAGKEVKSGKAGKTKEGGSLNPKTKSKAKKRDFGEPDLVARVSWFNDSVTASGVSASDKLGVALNLKPGTASGWNNSKTDKWMIAAGKGKPYYARIVIKGKTITVPIIDKGPHESTGRGIDITLKTAERMGWSASNFPTDSIGKVYLLGQKRKG